MELHHTDILTDMIVIRASQLRMWSEIKALTTKSMRTWCGLPRHMGSRSDMSKTVNLKDQNLGEGTLKFPRTTMVRMLFLHVQCALSMRVCPKP